MSAAPPFAALLRHLADAPPDWQAPVELRRRPGVRISALLASETEDLLRRLAKRLEAAARDGEGVEP